MTRRHRDQTFRKTDVVRAYSAAQSAGIAKPRIEIDTARKTITIIAGEPTANSGIGASATPDDLDRELAEFRAQHGEG